MKLFLFLLLGLLCAGELRAQQNDLQLLLAPSADFARGSTRDISGGWLGLRGPRADLNGLDVSVTYGERGSSGTYDSTAFGAALIGEPGGDRVYFSGVKRSVAGLALHGGASRFWLYGGGEIPRLALLAGVPVSFGDYSIIHNNKEVGKFYNVLAGVQGGAALNARAGRLLVTPSAMLSFMGGYVEKYKGGVYLSNMSSGGVRPFCVLTLGLELGWLPAQARLRAAYQRYFSNGAERALDGLTLQLTLGWGALHKAAPGGGSSPIGAEPR